MGNKNVSEYFFQFTDLLSAILDDPEIVLHEQFFLFSAYQRLLERLLDKCETKLTPAQKEYNKMQLDRFLKKIAELGDDVLDKLPEAATIGTPLYIPSDLVEKWDPERIEGEVRTEATKWLNSGAKKVIGKPNEMSTITLNDQERSMKMVQDLYDKGAEYVEVVDPIIGGGAYIIRVTLPWDPTEDVDSGNAPLADKALAALSFISELDACSIKQDPNVENAFYVSWIEEESNGSGA